jgi:hypothetical protein
MIMKKEKKRVDSHAGYKKPKKKLRISTKKKPAQGAPIDHKSSSSSLSASSSNPPYRPWETTFQSPLGRGRKLSLRARFAFRAIVCGFLDVDVPSPVLPTPRAEYDPGANCNCAEPTLDECGRGRLDGGRPIPSAACCLGIVADTARGACTGRTEEPRTGTGIAILLAG